MKKAIYLILSLIVLILIVAFTLQNPGDVNVHLVCWDLTMPLAILIVALFSFGVVVSIFVLTPTIIALKSTLKKDDQLISELQEANSEHAEEEAARE